MTNFQRNVLNGSFRVDNVIEMCKLGTPCYSYWRGENGLGEQCSAVVEVERKCTHINLNQRDRWHYQGQHQAWGATLWLELGRNKTSAGNSTLTLPPGNIF